MKREFIIDWFSERSTLSREEIEQNMNSNYLENGYIDSFAFLELINECEEKLNIQFSDEDFNNDGIFTIEGLIAVVENK